MNIKPINNKQDYENSLNRLEDIFEAKKGTVEGEELEILSILLDKYEEEHFPIGMPDPIEAIKFRMEQQGLKARDLEEFIGSSGRVSEILNRKRPLSLKMIKCLHKGLHIPYESLLAEVHKLTNTKIQPITRRST